MCSATDSFNARKHIKEQKKKKKLRVISVFLGHAHILKAVRT